MDVGRAVSLPHWNLTDVVSIFGSKLIITSSSYSRWYRVRFLWAHAEGLSQEQETSLTVLEFFCVCDAMVRARVPKNS